MKRHETRLYYEKLCLQCLESANLNGSVIESNNSLMNIWITNHSLQLTRTGLHYLKIAKLPLIDIQIENGRSMAELLMLAKTMDVPYFVTEQHISQKLRIISLESDRTMMLVMQNGNVSNWAAMFG